eukprot:g2379.t1
MEIACFSFLLLFCRDVIIALGVVVGVSWEPVFNKSVAVAAHSFSNPPVVRLLLSAAIVLLLLPAWKRFVLTKQISYTETRSERRSRSYLTKDQDVLNPPQSKQEFRGCGFACGTPELEKLYLLDGRNIACQGGESPDRPNLKKLSTAMKWHIEHRPDWKVETFVYQALMEKWQKDHAEDMKDLAQCLTVTPRREDVDKFIIRKAVDAAKSGCLVKIVSNDNFREYIGTVNDFHFSEDWVREHVIKFCFSAGSQEFIPADGFGTELPCELQTAEPEPSVPERPKSLIFDSAK